MSTANIPPGITFLVKKLPQIVIPPAATALVLYLYHNPQLYSLASLSAPSQLSTWVTTTIYILSFPIVLAISMAYSSIVNRITAARMGAALLPKPPFMDDPTPGGLLSLQRAFKGSKSGYIGDGLDKRIQAIGPAFITRILFTDRVITFEPSHIKAILATQFEDFDKGRDAVSTLSSLLGTGVFAVDGELWKFHRSITRPFFSKDKITHFDIFDRHADVAIKKMKARLNEGYAFDFQDVVSRFTLDSATEFLFGRDIGTLSDPLPYPFFYTSSNDSDSPLLPTQTFSARFSHSFNDAQSHTAVRSRFGEMWPLFEFWKDKTKEKIKPVHEFLEPIMKEGVRRGKAAKENLKEGEKPEESETVLDHLITYTEDPILLRDEILNLAVAGRDTTASLMTFTVYMLSQHPNILRRLREEILTIIGPDRRPSYDDMREMKYLRAVLNEVLRLYPAVPFNMRMSNKNTTLPPIKAGDKPFFIPAGTRCVYSVFVMHRRQDLWGPDALTFDPDRFLDQRLHKYLTPNPFIFLPFNAGPRICLGQQFAYNESSFFLVRLLQHFSSIELSAESQPPASRPPASWKEEGGIKATEKVMLRSHLTMYVVDGLWVKMGEAPVAEDI